MGGKQSSFKEDRIVISSSNRNGTYSNTISNTINPNNNNDQNVNNCIKETNNQLEQSDEIVTNQLNYHKETTINEKPELIENKELVTEDVIEEVEAEEEEEIWYQTMDNYMESDLNNNNNNNNNNGISNGDRTETIIATSSSQSSPPQSSSQSTTTTLSDNQSDNLSDNQLNLKLFKLNLLKKREERHLAIDLLKKKLNKMKNELINERNDKILLINIIKDNNIDICNKKLLLFIDNMDNGDTTDNVDNADNTINHLVTITDNVTTITDNIITETCNVITDNVATIMDNLVIEATETNNVATVTDNVVIDNVATITDNLVTEANSVDTDNVATVKDNIVTDSVATITDSVKTDNVATITDSVEKDNVTIVPDNSVTAADNLKLKKQIAHLNLSLQLSNAECLTLTNELAVVQKQVDSLKDVIKISKEMIDIREQQINQLKNKLTEIEASLGERELKIMSDNLRKEYDRQLINIRNLRGLYEERARVCAIERENMMRQITEQKQQLENELEKNKTLTKQTDNLQDELETSNVELTNIKQEFTVTKSEQQELQEEMSIINKMFSQMLIGFNSDKKCLNIDRLTEVLEENRELINDMTISEISTGGGSTLPKLLLDLVKQAEATTEINKLNETINDNDVVEDDNQENKTMEAGNNLDNLPSTSNVMEINENVPTTTTIEEIILNLPKVWRILIELLGHHKEVSQVPFIENGEAEDCYKSVQTPNGTELVLSVSKTFIKLKDLILEKKSLQKETTRLKTLNGHLERRLNTQEKRLGAVSLELTKTWHLVSRMQRQHRQLHTHEQILRYQLQQKRRLLNELKDELEYCRKKWSMAREKNNETEIQWKHLQNEFARRKLSDLKSGNKIDDSNSSTETQNSQISDEQTLNINNSAESGYSGDEQISDDSDNDIAKTNLINIEITTNTQNIIDELYLENDLQIHPAPVYTATTTILPQLQQAAVVIVENTVEHINGNNGNKTISGIVKKSTQNKLLGARPKLLKGTNPTTVKLSTEVKKLSKISSSHKMMGGKGGNGGNTSGMVKGNKHEETLEEMFLRLSGVETDDQDPIVTDIEETIILDNITLDEETDIDADDDDTDHSDDLDVNHLTMIKNNPNLPSTSGIKTITPITSTSLPSTSITDNNHCETNSIIILPQANQKNLLTFNEQEYTERRAARLKRLEDECNQLMNKMTKNLTRGNVISEQIDDLRVRCANQNQNLNHNQNQVVVTVDEINPVVINVNENERIEISNENINDIVNTEVEESHDNNDNNE